MGTHLFDGVGCRGWVTISSPLNITASGSTFTPTIPAMTNVRGQHEWYGNNVRRRYKLEGYIQDSATEILKTHITGWSSVVANNTINATIPAGNAYSINTSSLFSSKNPTTKTVPLYLGTYGPTVSYYVDGNWYDELVEGAWTRILTINVTLNAPPTISATAVSGATSAGVFIKGVSTASFNSGSAQYGGSISSKKLTIGSQTATASGTVSIIPDTVGTFTPSVTVTDSRGQTTTKSLSSITVIDNVPTTYDTTQVMSDTDGLWKSVSTASVTVSNISVMSGYSVSNIRFNLGSQHADVTPTGSSATLSIVPNAVGTFTPTIVVTDTRGVTTTTTLNSITVNDYVSPSIGTASLTRTNQNGVAEDEGAYGLITMDVNYVNALGDLLEPIVTVTDEGTTTSGTVTWYDTWSSSQGVSSAIDWTDYNPTSPTTMYGLVSYGTGFSTQKSYQISVTARDTMSSSVTIMQTLDTAFYTIDFLAGGHGIAFGQPASQDGFFCNMDSHFKDKANIMRALFDFVHPVGSYYETSDASFDPNVTWGGTWVLETAGQVHVSAGTGYTIGSTGGNKDAIIPYHNHSFTNPTVNGGSCSITSSGGHSHTVARYANSGTAGTGYTWDTTSSSVKYNNYSVTGNGAHTHTVPDHTHSVSGGSVGYAGTSGNVTNANMQPYIVVNRWHRTA